MKRIGKVIVIILFGCIILFTIVARFELLPSESTPNLKVVSGAKASDNGKLFVFVHGLGGGRNWKLIQETLSPYGHVISIKYPRAKISNADPVLVSQLIARKINAEFKKENYENVTLIGQSMGALLVKRTFLYAEKLNQVWASRVSRIVLVAGMNRGWDITGQKPSDMGPITSFQIWFGSWLARLVGLGNLILSMEAGSPFVANLRLDWIKRMAESENRDIEVVQLLGDIDDLVSAEDNKDLRSLSKDHFAWIKVRGTGHSNIVDFADQTAAGTLKLGEYRRQKFLLATTEPNFSKLMSENEVLPFQPNTEVTHVVFVVHGIRDLGEWAAAFEQELQVQFRGGQVEGSKGKLAVASVRYGFFGMGPFLFKPIREKYVKWLMDEFTETLAQYPNAKEVNFIGHSNGTYLIATALERYESMNFNRIVFGGSVVRQDYDWDKVLLTRATEQVPEENQKLKVVNYKSVDDWVVALFPRFFEPTLTMTVLKNNIGSAGFNGFSTKSPQVRNVSGLSGGHAAFLSRIPEIVSFILGIEKSENPQVNDSNKVGKHYSIASKISDWGSKWGTWFIIWPFLTFVIVTVGWHVVTAATEPRWPIFLVYVVLLSMILRYV